MFVRTPFSSTSRSERLFDPSLSKIRSGANHGLPQPSKIASENCHVLV